MTLGKLSIASIMGLALTSTACMAPRQPRDRPVVLNAGAFNPVENTDLTFSGADEVVEYYLVGTGRSAPTTRAVDNDPKGGADMVVIFSAEGYEDDSVAGEQWRVALRQVDGGYHVFEAGVRYRCYRADPTRWRKALCP